MAGTKIVAGMPSFMAAQATGCRNFPHQEVRERAACFERPRVLEKLQLEKQADRTEAEIVAIDLDDGPPDARTDKAVGSDNCFPRDLRNHPRGDTK
jgi:hypothetical protein